MLITDTQTDRYRHFPDIVKSCFGHTKTYISIKNRSRKLLQNHYFLLFMQKKVKNLFFVPNYTNNSTLLLLPLLDGSYLNLWEINILLQKAQ